MDHLPLRHPKGSPPKSLPQSCHRKYLATLAEKENGFVDDDDSGVDNVTFLSESGRVVLLSSFISLQLFVSPAIDLYVGTTLFGV